MSSSSRPLADASAFVILGAAGGIGSRIAEALTADGATLVLAGRTLEKLTPLASTLGAEAHAVEASDFAAVESLVAEARPAMDASRGS